MREANFMTQSSSTQIEIDAALRFVGALQPHPGFEQRLLTRLHSATADDFATDSFAARLTSRFASRTSLQWFPAWNRIAAGAVLAAGFAAGIIGLALHKPPIPAQPSVQRPASGFGTAGVSRMPSHAIHPAAIPGNRLSSARSGRAINRTRQSRAILAAPPSRRGSAAVTPKSPYQGGVNN